jgi:hypothetical protein
VPGLGGADELEAVLAAADLLKPAKAAARELCPEHADDTAALARALRERYDAAVVITDGEAGCAIAAPGFEGQVPACVAKEVVDTTGAGDAFLGGLLAALHHGLAFPEAAMLANACGAACVERLGAFPDDPGAARRRVLELYDGPALDLGPLPAAAEVGRAAGEALSAYDAALDGLRELRARLDPASFERATVLLRAAAADGGRVHVTGVGKPEHLAHYAASLLSSTGTPATFLHATETIHGSAGQVMPGDVVIAISNSGETAELRQAVAAVRRGRARGGRPRARAACERRRRARGARRPLGGSRNGVGTHARRLPRASPGRGSRAEEPLLTRQSVKRKREIMSLAASTAAST